MKAPHIYRTSLTQQYPSFSQIQGTAAPQIYAEWCANAQLQGTIPKQRRYARHKQIHKAIEESPALHQVCSGKRSGNASVHIESAALPGSISQITGIAEPEVFAGVCDSAQLQSNKSSYRRSITKNATKKKREEPTILLRFTKSKENGIAVIHPEFMAVPEYLSQISGIAESEVYAVLHEIAQLQSTNNCKE